jgi:glycyl-tRNA synthetase
MEENVQMSPMDKIVNLAKRRGFVYPSSDIYGGLANAWDYGPLGVELKNNIKKLWWNFFVTSRRDMVGLDSSIILNPKVWEASGHVKVFNDPLVDCKSCHSRFRADNLIEEQLKIDIGGKSLKELSDIIIKEKLKCPSCGKSDWTDARSFNLLFETHLGVIKDDKSLAYLRGETAQGIFINFKNILNTTRQKIPFGVGQIGKSFRNEVTPGNFIFRTREFEQMEIEYFIKPTGWEAIFEKWLEDIKTWLKLIGLKDEDLHFHEIEKEALAHYSKRTVDIEYKYPFGQSELYGLAYRTDFDLKNHQTASGVEMTYTDEETGEKYLPHVVEPSFGVERTFLAVLANSYTEEAVPDAKGEDASRIVLKLPKTLAPYKIAVLPLSKKTELSSVSQEVFELLAKKYTCDYDETQSIGKRYRRQDEIGTPYCVTIDFETLNDKAVTVRDRDTMKQDRVAINKLDEYLSEKLK